MRRTVDADRSDLQQVGGRLARASGTTEDRPDAQYQFLRAERLGEIVVSTERQSANAILLFLARGEHQHGDVSRSFLGADVLQHVEAAHAGQHQVQYQQRRPLGARDRERVGAVGRRRDTIIRLCEMIRDQRNDVRLIIDNENALLHVRGWTGHAVCSLVAGCGSASAECFRRSSGTIGMCGAPFVARRCRIFAKIISIATVL